MSNTASTIQRMIAQLKSECDLVGRDRAMSWLAKRGPSVETMIREYACSWNGNPQRAALGTLGRMQTLTPESRLVLLAALVGDSPETNLALRDAPYWKGDLPILTDEEIVLWITGALHASHVVRETTRYVFGRMIHGNRARLLPRLLRRAQRDDRTCRCLALEAIGAMGNGAEPYWDDVADIAWRAHERTVQNAAAQAMYALNPTLTREFYVRHVTPEVTEDELVRAISGLGGVDPHDSEETIYLLIQYLHDDRRPVRLATGESIAAIALRCSNQETGSSR